MRGRVKAGSLALHQAGQECRGRVQQGRPGADTMLCRPLSQHARVSGAVDSRFEPIYQLIRASAAPQQPHLQVLQPPRK